MLGEGEFLTEILHSPGDLAPRLVFADWLEEQGDPRGEFIRIQCELSEPSDDLSRRDELDHRQEQLRRQFEHEWTRDVRGLVNGWTFHCGFVESVEATADQLMKHGDRLRQLTPIRYLTIQSAASTTRRIMELQLIQQLEILRIERSRLSVRDVDAIRIRGLPQAHTLALSQCDLTDDTFAPLLELHAPKLHDLDVSINQLRNRTAIDLVKSPLSQQLRSVNLFANQIRQKGAMALAEEGSLPRLQYLEIRGNSIGRSGAHALLKRFGRIVMV
ncbi:MAG: TIGR02996 domain-containing protein [Planctomycetaceae bacterium]|nr:TIGR02996 domain-containing protein [Planctomycetaceae bacterium]